MNSSSEIEQRIIELEQEWGLDIQRNNISSAAGIQLGIKSFYSLEELGADGMPLRWDIEALNVKLKNRQIDICELLNKAKSIEVDMDDTIDPNGNEFKICERINRIFDSIDDSYEIIYRMARYHERLANPMVKPIIQDCDFLRFRASTWDVEDEKITPYQRLLLALLSHAYRKNYRRYNGWCCEEIETADGNYTKAWKPVMTISDFVYSISQKETQGSMWRDLTQKGSNTRDAIKFLNECKDVQFSEIYKDRSVWSFKNGIFCGKVMEGGKYICKFYPYDSKEYASLPPTLVSSKFFDQPFDNYDHIPDWWDIPTPIFQSILDYQGFDAGVSKWMYVMGGKLCYNVGDIDGWQVIPFLKGIARSGKSTIITKVFKKFYNGEDVRTLSNNIEKKFGLSSIYDGLMFIAPEVKGDLCLEQAEFQSLVSGEDLSIACKHEKAKSIEWKTPGILGGNEIPNWKDNSGSVLRRILAWNFSKQVSDADPHLDQKLEKELPTILVKCVKAYLDYSDKYSSCDIWNAVPKYFKDVQQQVAMVTNPLQHFLASEKLRFGADLFVPQTLFISAFNHHCLENNLGKHKFTPDFYVGPFSSKPDVQVKTNTCTYKGKVYHSQAVIYGIDIYEDTMQIADDEL